MKTLSQINLACSLAYQLALSDAKRGIGRGVYMSRGRFLKAVDFKGNVVQGECESWAWDGKASTLAKALQVFDADPDVAYISIEGGINYAESVSAFRDGAYDPYVEDWAVTVFTREADRQLALPDDYIIIDGAIRRVLSVTCDRGEFTYNLDHGGVAGNRDFTLNDVRLQSEVL